MSNAMSNAEMYDFMFFYVLCFLVCGVICYFIWWILCHKDAKLKYINLLDERSDLDDVSYRTRRML